MVLTGPRCPICRYNLSGTDEPRCPECGKRFSDAEWANRSHWGATPAIERVGYVSFPRAALALFVASLFRPFRLLRGLRPEINCRRAVAYFLVLLTLAPLLGLGLGIAAATFAVKGSQFEFYFQPLAYSKLTWRNGAEQLLSVAVGTTSFFVACILACLPTLLTLDIVLWRKRPIFRILVKSMLYMAAWIFWPMVLMMPLGNRALVMIDNDWMWGFRGGWSLAGFWPWICWLAASEVTILFLASAYSGLAPRGAAFSEDRSSRRRIALVLLCGWLAAMWLLLFDTHIQLRFYLQFCHEVYRGFTGQ